METVYVRINWENQPSTKTAISALNLNKIDLALSIIDGRVVAIDATKLDRSIANGMVQDVTLDEQGIFSITKLDGSVKTYDTALEKIAVNFYYDEENQRLVLQLEDGTEQYVDLSSLITEFEFLDSSTIGFSVDSGKVTAEVKNGSITGEKLQPDYLADVLVAEQNAQNSATAAADSAADAEQSAGEAALSAAEAKQYRDEAAEIVSGDIIDDSATSIAKTWSSQKIDSIRNMLTADIDYKLDVDGDSKDNTVTFQEATEDIDIASGESHTTIFGKLLKSIRHLRLTKLSIGNDYRPSLAINDSFQVWQRGTSFAGLTQFAYTADRWRAETGDGGNISVTKNSNGLAFTVNQAGGFQSLHQPIDPMDFDKLNGKTVVIHVKAENTANIEKVGIYGTVDDVIINGTGFVESTTLLSTSTDIVVRITIPNGKITYLGVIVSLKPTLATTVFQYVKAEVNDHATPFIPRPYAEELALCKRYYEKSRTTGNANGAIICFTPASMSYLPANVRFTVPKRIVPTVSIESTLGTSGKISAWSSNIDETFVASVNTATLNENGFNTLGLSTAGAANEFYAFHYVADAEI